LVEHRLRIDRRLATLIAVERGFANQHFISVGFWLPLSASKYRIAYRARTLIID
jgi:hypothetical protein